MLTNTNSNKLGSVKGEGSTGIFENPHLKFNSNRIDSGYNTPNKSGSETKKQEIDSHKILQILCQLPLGYNTPENKSTQKAVKEIKSEESTLVEKRVIIDTGIFDHPILLQIDNDITEEDTLEEQEPARIVIDTGIFDRPILIQDTEIIEKDAKAVKEVKAVKEEVARPIIIDTGIFDRPILIQNVEQQSEINNKDVVVSEVVIPDTRADTGLWWLFAKPEIIVVEEEVQEVKPIIIDTGIFDRPILIQNNEQPIVEEVIEEVVVEEVKPIIIDTGIFDRPILIQNSEQEPGVIVREIVIEEPIVEATVPETRADTGLWWLFAKPEIVEVEEAKPIVIDTGIFDRPILIQNVEQPTVKEVVEEVVEEVKPIIIDTGIFDRPILIQNSEQEPGVIVREIVIEEPIVEASAPETRADTGLWWLFAKPEVEEVKPIIIDTGIFDRPILIQNSEQKPEVINREVIVEEPIVEAPAPETRADTGLWWLFAKPEVEEVKPIIIDTGIFDRPILIQNSEQEPEVINREVIVEEPIVEAPAPETRADTGLWWLFAKPEVVEVEEEKAPEVTRVVIDTGIFDRPILIQNIEQPIVEKVEEFKPIIIDTGIFDRPILIQNVEQQPEVNDREVIMEEEKAPETTRIIIDTGIFDRPILIQKPHEVVEAVKEITGTIIDTGIFDRPIYIQEVPTDADVIVENTREAPEIMTNEGIDYELRGDTSLWWLFYKQDNTNVIEIKRDTTPTPQPVSYLNVNHKLPLGYKAKPWAPRSSCVIQPLIKLPLAVDYLFEPKVEEKITSTSREAPVASTSDNDYHVLNVNHRLPLGYNVRWAPKNDVLNVNHKLPLGYKVEPWVPRSSCVIQPLIKLPLAVDYLFEPKVEVTTERALEYTTPREIKEISPVNVNNNENVSVSEVDRLKSIINYLTSKLEQKQQSETNLNGRVANLSLMLNEADQKNKDLIQQYESKYNDLLSRYVQLNNNLARVTLAYDDQVKELKSQNNNDNVEIVSREAPVVIAAQPQPQPQAIIETPKVSMNKMAQINRQLATLTLDYDTMVREKNKALKEMNGQVDDLRQKVSGLNTQLAVVSLNTNDEIKQSKKDVKESTERADKFSKTAANLNTNIAVLSLAYNDNIRNLNQAIKEKDQKINDLQMSNAKTNGQLANLTLNIDETLRNIKNEATPVVVEATPRAAVVEATPRSAVVVPSTNDDEALKTKMAKMNTNIAVLSLAFNDTVRDLKKTLKEKDQKIDDLQMSNAKINGQLANLTLIVDETLRNIKNETTPVVVEATPRSAVVVPSTNDDDELKTKMAKMNTNIAVLSLDFNDTVRDLKKTLKEKDQKIDDLQMSNAKINGQLANLTLNVDETLRNIKNETTPVVVETTTREIVDVAPIAPRSAEVIPRSVDVSSSSVPVANDNSDALKAKMAQINTQLAKLSLATNEEVRALTKDNRAKANEVEKLRNKLGQLNTQVAVLSLRVNEVEKANAEMEKNNNEIIDDLRNKLAETNGNLAKVTLNSNDEIHRMKKITKDYDNTLDDLRTKAAKINTCLAVTTLDSNDTINKLKKIVKEDEDTIESLRNKAAEINTQLAVVSLNTPLVPQENVIEVVETREITAPQENITEVESREITIPEVPAPVMADIASDKEDVLRAKAAEINTRLALITLKYDDDVNALKKTQKQKDAVIEDLRDKAAALNTNLAILSLDSNEERACLKEIAVEKQLEVEALRSNASQLNSQLANLTLNLDEVLRSNNAYLNDKAEEVEFLRQCTVQLNKQLAQLTLSFDEILKNNNGYMIKQQEEIDNLTKKATELNGRLARLTLNYDELNHASQKQSKKQEETIEQLQQKAAQLNGSIAKLTLDFDEMVKQKQNASTPVINIIPEPEIVTREVIVKEVVPMESKKDNDNNANNDKFRDIAVKLNHNLATLTLDYDTLKKENETQQKVNIEKIDLLQKERCRINNNLARVTLQYDEDMAKKNGTIKNYKNKLNATNIAYNNARRGSVVAKIQKIEKLTDMSTNLNGNLAKVTLEFNEMVQSKDAEINKLKNTLKRYENVNGRRASTITVEYNDVNYYNINANSEKKVNKEMGTSTDNIISTTKEVPSVPPAAEPVTKEEVTTTEVVTETVVVDDTNGKKNKKKGKSKSSKKNKALVKKSNKYTDLTIEQRKAMNKEIVNQSCTIL